MKTVSGRRAGFVQGEETFVGPYRRFVESQRGELNEARGELVTAEDSLLRLKVEIEKR